MNEARKSFMSGHSAFSFYCATVLIIYLHARLSSQQPPGTIKRLDGTQLHRTLFRGLKVLRPFLQFVLFLLAFYIASTRISDYRHHTMDVVTGAIIGMIFAGLVVFGLVNIFRRPRSFGTKFRLHTSNLIGQNNSKGAILQDTNISQNGQTTSSELSVSHD